MLQEFKIAEICWRKFLKDQISFIDTWGMYKERQITGMSKISDH